MDYGFPASFIDQAREFEDEALGGTLSSVSSIKIALRACCFVVWGVRYCEADPRTSLVQRRLSFFLFFIKSAAKLVVEQPMTMDSSLIVAAVTDADTCLCS